MADEYGRFQLIADPLADALVTQASERKQNLHQMMELALRRGIHAVDDPPPALIEMFEHLDRVPNWVDFEQLRLGARTYQRLGPASMLILSAWSLMNGYRCGPAVKPLALTGALERMAPRRLAETSRFVTEVAQTSGMRRHREGFVLTARVRVFHAMVRRMLLRGERWNTQAWGAPINQSDMVGTVIEFSLLVLAGARKMGFHFADEEAEAVVQLWRYCGYISGVNEQLLYHLRDEDSGVRFATMVDNVQAGPDRDSLALAQALRRVPRQMAKTPVQKRLSGFVTRYHDGLTWAFNGEQIAHALKIPNPAWRYAIYPTRAFIGAAELARRTLPGASKLATRLGNRLVRDEVNRMLGGVEPEFTPARAV